MLLPEELPTPDQYGNYWLWSSPNYVQGPAIFPSKKLVDSKDGEGVVRLNGYWIASTGNEILWDRSIMGLQRFASPKRALAALQKRENA